MVFVGPKLSELFNYDNLVEKVSKAVDETKEFINDALYVDEIVDFSKETLQKAAKTVNISLFEDSNSEVGSPLDNKKILIIGDSQTVGTYGTELDNLVRGTKAKVVTFASCGSSPEWWFNGHSTTCGYWSKNLEGKEFRENERPTPLIENLLEKEKPDIVIVTMGGNMMKDATQATVTESVSKLGNAISASGADMFWAGPPKYDPKKRTPEQLETFYGYLKNVVPEFGTLIDSRQYIDKYSGPDGLHYWGPEGRRQTTKWANGVFNEINQKLKDNN